LTDPITNHDKIFISSAFTEEGKPLVCWKQGQYQGTWDTDSAIAIGTGILLVAGMSLAEGTIAITLLQSQEIDPDNEEYKIKLNQILQMIRSNRMHVSDLLKPIFGYYTQQPLIEIGCYKTARTLTIEGAMKEARLILEAANAAITDALLYQAMTKAGVKDNLQQKVFKNLLNMKN